MIPPPPPAPCTASTGAAGFRLLQEPASADAGLRELAIDSRGSALWLDEQGELRVLSASDVASGTDAACVLLEAIEVDRQPALVLAVPPGERVRLNGTPAPPLAVLAVADVLQVAEHLYHVSWYEDPRIGPPPDALIGVPCSVCKNPVTATATVLVHICGSPLHLEPREDQLQCGLLGCGDCEKPVVLESGLVYRPAL